jgi:hypothetical protein
MKPGSGLFTVPHFKVGLTLVLVFWSLNWGLPQSLRPAAYLFFPLWLGYALVVDALAVARTGTSIRSRSRKAFVWLFVGSAPAWWLFELINLRTCNWEYPGAQVFSDLEYFLLCTVAFSTVMPAVFGTAELVRSWKWMDRFAQGPRVLPNRRLAFGLFVVGMMMLSATLLWPETCYPLVWGSVFLLLEPFNILLRRPSLFDWLRHGDWRPVISLACGSLVCGFFWEMWNFHSYPKWVYHTPGAEFLHVFEMPLLGYLGYIPFAWELFSLRNLILPREGGPRL